MEEHVSFELAKLAREIGFNYKSYAWYSTKGELNLRKYDDSDSDDRVVFGYSPNSLSIDAPTLSSLKKWVRENYDIHVHIVCRNGRWIYQLHEIFEELRAFDEVHESEFWEDSYEKALDSGLQKALKINLTL